MSESAPAQTNLAEDARTSNTGKTTSIWGVQYLRGVACIAVIVFHAYGGSEGDFYVGQAGVDLFFLISGFIMWTVTSRREQKPGQFLLRRLIRIVPLYWAITLLVFARRYVLGKATLPDLVYSVLFIPHRMSDGTLDPIVVPGWTLNFEMFFYLVFAACLLISVRRRLAAATIILTCLVAIGLVMDHEAPIVWAYTSPLLLEFVAGAWIGYGASRTDPRAGWALLLLGTAALAVQQLADTRLVEWRVLAFGLPCAGILLGTLFLERSMPHSKMLKLLGDASYAIYLVHVPIMSLLLRLDMPPALSLLVNVVLSTGIGAAFHSLDRRFNRRLNARLNSLP